MATTLVEQITLRPQNRQENFLASSADIAIFGGSAGGGKSWSLLIEPLRHIDNPQFGAVIFRRTVPEITKEGGLWDESNNIYPLLNSTVKITEHAHYFQSGAKIAFSHLSDDNDLAGWRGAQIPLIEFDQLETFTEKQFWYMLSRNRSMCGIRPYVRASANPQPGWLADFLAWWIADDGYAIAERSGAIRWMVRENDGLFWNDSREALQAAHPNSTPKSVTFILSTVFDNPILLNKDPDYLANLQALDYIERMRLLGDGKRGGNWLVKPSAGKLFNRAWFEIVDAIPFGLRQVRFWDFAATEAKLDLRARAGQHDPDFTASTKGGKHDNGIIYITDVTNDQISPARTDSNVLNLAKQDGVLVAVRWEQEGGASGKRDSYHLATMLHGFDARGVPPQGDKIARAKPLMAQAEVGNVKLLRGAWNEGFLTHMHGQPDLPHDDIFDSSSGLYNVLVPVRRLAGAFGREIKKVGNHEQVKA